MRPSSVVISRPWASTASVRQAYRGTPSIRTVQAPHSPRSHPGLAPVRPMTSRRTWSSVQRVSTDRTWVWPLTRRAISAVRPAGMTWGWAASLPAASTSSETVAPIAPAPMVVKKLRRVMPPGPGVGFSGMIPPIEGAVLKK